MAVEGSGYLADEGVRRLGELTLLDDEFMRVAFQGQLELAQGVLRTITEVPDLVLVREETQRDVRRLAGARSVILDVYGEDEHGRRYDLEVQRDDRGADPRRARYYGSAMDVEALGAGKDFSELPERYVIFVTEGDFFGRGAGCYRFEAFDEREGVALGDGAHVVYANGSYRGDDELGRLMRDFSCSDPDDMEPGPLADRVRYLKRDPEGMRQMSKIVEEICAAAVEEAVGSAVEEATEKCRLETLAALVRDGMLPMASAAERAGLTPEQFAERAAEYGFALD